MMPEPAKDGTATTSTDLSEPLTRVTLAERGFVGFVPFADLPMTGFLRRDGLHLSVPGSSPTGKES